MMTSQELREKFIKYFENKGHKLMSPSSLVSDDPTTLFTTAGMQQFKKYYLDPSEAPAKNIVTVQPCVRTSDINEVGDDTHLTFFEMLGNFSFGGYFKKEAINFAWEFLTNEIEIEKNRITATYFDHEEAKNGIAIIMDTDEESKSILENLKKQGLNEIKGCGEDNFWTLGTFGSPGGRTVEFYVDGVEVWNIVFNEAVYKDNPSPHWNWFRLNKELTDYELGIDTGMGLERMLAMKNKSLNIFETDLLKPICEIVSNKTGQEIGKDDQNIRIIADHLRAATFLVAEGVRPGKNEKESVLRTLIRRSVQAAGMQQVGLGWEIPILEKIIDILSPNYRYLSDKKEEIIKVISDEIQTFQNVLTKCEKILKDKKEFNAKDAYDLLQSQGCPIRLYKDYAANSDKKVEINDNDIEIERKKHQDLSRTASAGMFKGGLASGGQQETKYHTATHLLHAALRKVLGETVEQRGSNINEERMRFDFSYPEKLTDEQIKEVETDVNNNIKKDLPVNMDEMSLEDARNCGAIGLFESKYGDKVKVYSIGDVSKEICGGPHVKSTSELGHFKITKEESSSAGIRRIKAILE